MRHVDFIGYQLLYTSFACAELLEQRYLAEQCGCLSGALLSTPELRNHFPFCEKLQDNFTSTLFKLEFIFFFLNFIVI